jgi:hypothetical protein
MKRKQLFVTHILQHLEYIYQFNKLPNLRKNNIQVFVDLICQDDYRNNLSPSMALLLVSPLWSFV